MLSKNYNSCLKVISRLKIVKGYSKEVIWKNYQMYFNFFSTRLHFNHKYSIVRTVFSQILNELESICKEVFLISLTLPCNSYMMITKIFS